MQALCADGGGAQKPIADAVAEVDVTNEIHTPFQIPSLHRAILRIVGGIVAADGPDGALCVGIGGERYVARAVGLHDEIAHLGSLFSGKGDVVVTVGNIVAASGDGLTVVLQTIGGAGGCGEGNLVVSNNLVGNGFSFVVGDVEAHCGIGIFHDSALTTIRGDDDLGGLVLLPADVDSEVSYGTQTAHRPVGPRRRQGGQQLELPRVALEQHLRHSGRSAEVSINLIGRVGIP